MRILAAAFIGIVSVCVPCAPAHAAGPVNESITLAEAFAGGPPVGWFASGAFTDSGEWTIDSLNGAFYQRTTESGAAGSFHLQGALTQTAGGGVAPTSWVIPRTGAGAYRSLTGSGTCSPMGFRADHS